MLIASEKAGAATPASFWCPARSWSRRGTELNLRRALHRSDSIPDQDGSAQTTEAIMAQTVQITCINKSDRDNPYERITHVGGGQTLLTSWRKTQPEAIAEIENGESQFFVSVGG